MTACKLEEHRNLVCLLRRDADFDEKLVIGPRGLEQPVKEFFHGDLALSGRTLHYQRGTQSKDTGGHFCRRIRQGDTAADSAAVADCDMGDIRHRFGDQRQVFGDDVGVDHFDMAGQRADAHRVAVERDTFKIVEPIDVDQHVGLRQTHVQRRHKALTTGEDTSSVAVRVEQFQRVFHAGRPCI